MMRINKQIFYLLFCLFVFCYSCKKDAGPGGKNSISGVIQFKNGASGNNDPASMAVVSIAYGTKEATTSFNQTIIANSDGSFKIEGLAKGDYFITAKYSDEHGFDYSTQGAAISIKSKKSNSEINLLLE